MTGEISILHTLLGWCTLLAVSGAVQMTNLEMYGLVLKDTGCPDNNVPTSPQWSLSQDRKPATLRQPLCRRHLSGGGWAFCSCLISLLWMNFTPIR